MGLWKLWKLALSLPLEGGARIRKGRAQRPTLGSQKLLLWSPPAPEVGLGGGGTLHCPPHTHMAHPLPKVIQAVL